MKKFFLLITLISVFALTGCFNNDDDYTQTEQNEQIEQIDEQNTDIVITAKDTTILYEKYKIISEQFEQTDENYKNRFLTFLNNLEEDNLLSLSNGEEITIDFIQNIPTKVELTKTYIKTIDDDTINEDDYITKDEKVEIDEQGYLKIITDFENSDIQGCLYEVVAQYDDVFISYVFGIKYSDYINLDNNKTGYLSSKDQQLYDKYKNDNDTSLLKNLDPLVIAQFFAQSLLEGDYDLAYTFFAQTDNLPTQYDFTKGLKDLYKPTKDEYIKNLKAVQNGTFVKEEENKGYVQYEVLEDHPMALDFVKNNDVWQVIYTPIE